MNNITVLKFGGSVLIDDGAVKNAAEIIKKEYEKGKAAIAVVSAQGGMTDALLSEALRLSDKPSKRELDVIMSAGELLSSSKLAIAVGNIGIKSVSLSGFQAGIMTSSANGEARIKDIDTARLKKEISERKVVVAAGFQGVNRHGDMTTLGRGGSDTTAVAIAAALNAEKCVVYSKVDGIYTADPEKVSDARKIKEIDYNNMQELSFLGVKVLNPRAVELARKYSVVLEVRSAFSDADGTVVKEEVSDLEKMLISGVTKKSSIARITVSGLKGTSGEVFSVFGLMSQNNINCDIILQTTEKDGTTDIAFTVSESNADAAAEILKNSGKFDEKDILCDKSVAKVSVVGAGMESHPGVAAAIYEALSEKNINVIMISSSEMRFSVVVKKEDADSAVSAIHKRFY